MVHGLELQTTVDEVEPSRAVHVHGSTQLTLRKRLFLAQVRCRHAPVRQGDLNVQRHRNDVRYQYECNAERPCRQRAPEEDIAKQEPVAGHEADFSRTNPPRLAAPEGGRPLGENMNPRQEVKVETSDAHDRIINVLLVWHDDFSSLVPHKCELVIRGAKRLEEGRAGGEKRNVLDIRVVFLCKFYPLNHAPPLLSMFLYMCANEKCSRGKGEISCLAAVLLSRAYRLVCDEMVDVMAALPPSHG